MPQKVLQNLDSRTLTHGIIMQITLGQMDFGEMWMGMRKRKRDHDVVRKRESQGGEMGQDNPITTETACKR